jgi:hypothetical protein
MISFQSLTNEFVTNAYFCFWCAVHTLPYQFLQVEDRQEHSDHYRSNQDCHDKKQ